MTSTYFQGTLIPSPIVRGSSGNTYGTHHSVLGVGGFMEVQTIAERNALPIDSINGLYHDMISSGQRRLGMLVYVYENENIYRLESPVSYSTYIGYTPYQKQAILADNNNWKLFISISGQTFSGERIWKQITELTHGFIAGDIIAYNGVADEYIKSTSINALSYEPLGIVSEVIGINDFNLTFSGYIDTFGMLDATGGTLIAGRLYYVSPIAGKLTLAKPQGLNEMAKPILATLRDDTGVVLQYNGDVKVQQGVGYDVFTGYTATTQTFLDQVITGATNIGFFSGMTGVQALDIDTGYVPNNGLYYSLYNYYYRDNTGIIRVGTSPIDGENRQGYLRGTAPAISWLWNEYTGSSNQVGWILVGCDISTSIGSPVAGITYVGTPFTAVTWTAPFYNNGVDIFILTSGSTLTGSTYSHQGPVYAKKFGHNLGFRTLRTENDAVLKITYDDNFINLSAATTQGTITGAINGLSVSVNDIKLGGVLTENTTIDGANLYNMRYTNLQAFTVESPLNIIKDTADYPRGLVYDNDYSLTYINRSLVDKEYVDNKVISVGGSGATTAGNGLTKVLTTILLGGSLSLNTTINGIDTHSFTLSRLCALSICAARGVYIDSAATPSGLTYAADYSASYVARSLVDKAYVGTQMSAISANNGITRAGNMISLGGALTGNTIIHGGNTYVMDFKCLGGMKICTANGTYLDTSGSPTGLVYFADYSPTYVDRSLVDRAYVLKAKTTKAITGTTASTYSVQTKDYFIGVDTSAGGFVGGYNVFLPAVPEDGREIVVTDDGGNAGLSSNTQIHVWGSGGKTILNWSEAIINTNYGSITFLYNGTFWSVIAFTAAPSYA